MTCFNAECLLAVFATSANAAPLLPELLWGQIWLSFGWSVVLAAAGVALFAAWVPIASRRTKGVRVALAAVLAVWCWLPGWYGASFWLGLAFQAPSIATVACCIAFLWLNRAGLCAAGDRDDLLPTVSAGGVWVVGAGVALGWVLLLDTLGVWPVSVYHWGFHPAAASLAVLIAGIAWAVGGLRCPTHVCLLALGGAALFVTLRLPTGNLWDALLDPLLWLGLNGVAVRRLWASKRA